jgi:hypothetical protein
VLTLPAVLSGDRGPISLQQVDQGLEALDVHLLHHDTAQHHPGPSQHNDWPVDGNQLVKDIARKDVNVPPGTSDQDSSQPTPGRFRKSLASKRVRTRQRHGGPR